MITTFLCLEQIEEGLMAVGGPVRKLWWKSRKTTLVQVYVTRKGKKRFYFSDNLRKKRKKLWKDGVLFLFAIFFFSLFHSFTHQLGVNAHHELGSGQRIQRDNVLPWADPRLEELSRSLMTWYILDNIYFFFFLAWRWGEGRARRKMKKGGKEKQLFFQSTAIIRLCPFKCMWQVFWFVFVVVVCFLTILERICFWISIRNFPLIFKVWGAYLSIRWKYWVGRWLPWSGVHESSKLRDRI